MTLSHRDLGPLLQADERIVWADCTRHALLRRMGLPPRTPGALLVSGLVASALAFAIGLTFVHAPDALRAAVVLGLAVVACALAAGLAWWRPARASYAATDRGRGFIMQGGEVLVFQIPPRIEVEASRDFETGELDLGILDVEVHPAGRRERRPVRLRAVAYPCIVAELIQGLSPTTIRA